LIWLTRKQGRQVKVQIQNVVATGDLNQRLDLESILRVAPEAKYEPEKFPGLVYRLRKPRTTTLLFTSGKMVCTGAKSEASARTAIRRLADELKAHGIVITGKPEARIENIVASGDLGGVISLEDVAARLTKTMYEPEQFPGLVYRMEEPNVVILIFASGKLVIAGAKREEELWLAAEKLKETLDKNELISYDEPPRRGDPIPSIAAMTSPS
jgi:transcription initiation factor TFIID TATA-box-binding protein